MRAEKVRIRGRHGSFPEAVRQLAWLGAEIVIQPTLTTTRDREMELVCARANAWSNQLYVVNVNTADPAGVGMSVIVDPEGIVRQQAGPARKSSWTYWTWPR
jgi:formamidase